MKFQLPWKHQKIYIYPNRYGFLFFALFALCIAVGATYNNNLVFLMGFVLISILFVCILLTAKNLRQLQVLDLRVASGFPGDKVPVEITVENKSSIPLTRILLSICKNSTEGELPLIHAGDIAKVRLTVNLPEQRGVYKTDRVKLATQNPFGLFYSWLWIKFPATYFVFPKPKGRAERPTKFTYDSGEFSGLKDFQAGDRLSRVSWKHFAKQGQMKVKEYNDSEDLHDLIDWEDAEQDDLEDRLSQLSLWLVQAQASRRHYALKLQKDLTRLGHGAEHLETCLTRLAQVDKQGLRP